MARLNQTGGIVTVMDDWLQTMNNFVTKLYMLLRNGNLRDPDSGTLARKNGLNVKVPPPIPQRASSTCLQSTSPTYSTSDYSSFGGQTPRNPFPEDFPSFHQQQSNGHALDENWVDATLDVIAQIHKMSGTAQLVLMPFLRRGGTITGRKTIVKTEGKNTKRIMA
ncbi:hypothetical protein Ciccas_004060 [Cichlidogyrus casuarinus]|uniref:Uncharacterized protein n=1 Tax=Cichlidogyrus casuarinus TaxID=1844966 RepID=A0ABD2QCK2_9PLAT